MFKVTDAEVGLSESNFPRLVQTLLKDPDESEHFFQVSKYLAMEKLWVISIMCISTAVYFQKFNNSLLRCFHSLFSFTLF